MMGILLVTHGRVGETLLAGAEGIIGKQSCARSLGLDNGESPDAFEKRLQKALQELESPVGTLILSDMLGGTPCNVCLRQARDPRFHFELVTGLSLPLLISALSNRTHMPLAQLARKLVEDAARAVQRPLERLKELGG